MTTTTATITTLQGRTGKDHLLAEIASKASESLKPSYSSRSAAKKAAERAIYRTVASRPLYTGCAAGLIPGAILRDVSASWTAGKSARSQSGNW